MSLDFPVAQPWPSAPARTGIVRASGCAIADDGGEFNAVGLSGFWMPWAMKFDPAKLDANLADTDPADYLRMFASVGPDFEWQDRQIDPAWPDYDQVYTGTIDRAYASGRRSFVTLFAGGSNTPVDKPAFVDRIARLGQSREHKIFGYEISNEGQGISGPSEARELGFRLLNQVPNLVALGTADDKSGCALYADWPSAATMHYARDFGGDDTTVGGTTYHGRPPRQPWGYPGEYESACAGKLPKTVIHGEGIGILTSGNWDDIPVDIALNYIITFIAKNSAYVFHQGAGIRGGGQGDVAPVPWQPWAPRAANYREQPTFAACMAAIKAAKVYLPPGLANWEKANAGWANAPYDGFAQHADAGRIVRAYSAIRSPETLTIVLGIRQSVTQAPKRAMTLELRNPLDCSLMQTLELGAGQPFTLQPGAGVLLHGRWK